MSDPQIKVMKKRAYSSVPDDILTNKSLSVPARLVLAYMIGRPDGWVIYVSQICHAIGISTGGKWRRVRNELEKAGYFRQVRERGVDGKIKWQHEVTDDPTILSKSTDGDPSYQNPLMVKPSDGETIHGGRQDITIGLEHRIKTKDCSSTARASARARGGNAAAPQSDTNKNKRRRQRPSGIVTWTTDDELEAQRIECEHGADDIGAAVAALVEAGKEPVPGSVAAQIKQQTRRKTAGQEATAHRAAGEARHEHQVALATAAQARGEQLAPAGMRSRVASRGR